MNKGTSIDEWIVVSLSKLTDAGWCNVDHQSTENLMIGTFIKPIIAITELTFIALSLLSNILQDKINIR